MLVGDAEHPLSIYIMLSVHPYRRQHLMTVICCALGRYAHPAGDTALLEAFCSGRAFH